MLVKRIFDIVVAITLMIFLLPIYLIVAIAVYLDLGSPVLFVQKRPGYKTTPFDILKFRTMKNFEGKYDIDCSDNLRITQFGKWLRSTSLDELPELLNVLKGDMSLVGPRPLLMEYIPLYNEKQNRRHEVRPGITGWAQISGRNSLNWNDKFDKDHWYVDNQSFLLDMKILLLTFKLVFMRVGISADGHVTMEKFRGND